MRLSHHSSGRWNFPIFPNEQVEVQRDEYLFQGYMANIQQSQDLSHMHLLQSPLHCTHCLSALIPVQYLPNPFHSNCLSTYVLLNQLCPDFSLYSDLISLSPSLWILSFPFGLISYWENLIFHEKLKHHKSRYSTKQDDEN